MTEAGNVRPTTDPPIVGATVWRFLKTRTTSAAVDILQRRNLCITTELENRDWRNRNWSKMAEFVPVPKAAAEPVPFASPPESIGIYSTSHNMKLLLQWPVISAYVACSSSQLL